mgnify:CR=1 FL=1
MGELTLRDLDPALQASLRARASAHGRSPEEEAKAILRDALGESDMARLSLAEAMRGLVGPEDAAPFPLPRREPAREPPDLDR